jgi:hypothetical protein
MSILSMPRTNRALFDIYRARAGMVWQTESMSKGTRMVKPTNARMGPGWLGLLLLLLCITVISCDKTSSDPAKSIDYMIIGTTVYAQPAYLDSVEVGIVVDGQLSMNEACWLGLWDLSQGYNSQPVWCDYKFYARSCDLVFHPFLRSEGVYGLKAGLCPYSSDACIPDSAIDLEGPLTISVGTSYWPRKSVEVEYDCMQDYDIRYGNRLRARLAEAFGGAGRTDISVVSDQVSIPAKVFTSIDTLNAWVQSNWWSGYFLHQTTAVLYVAGIKDAYPRVNFYGNNRDLDPSAAALSFQPPDGNIGDPGGYCVVFTDWFDYTFSSDDVEEAVLRAGTHEMGHLRAALTDAYKDSTGHQAGFHCVMDALRKDVYGNLVPGYQWFCAQCMLKIISVSW